MMLKSLITAAVLSTAAASPALYPRWTPTAACAQISASASSVLATSPKATPTVDAQLAHDCLTSASLHVEEATELVQAILPFLEFQSTIEYMKDPPLAFTEPASDIRANFAQILANISAGVYTSEYDFQAHLLKTFNAVHDGHFRFAPDLLTKALAFRRPLPLVSVSIDGKADPKVYSYGDILLSQNSSFVPSALSTINGENVYEYLEALAQLGRLNDPDALYNSIFYSPGFAAESPGWGGYFAGSGSYGYIYPGANTSVVFENGTTLLIKNYASVIGSFQNVTDGESLYQKFCTGPTSSSSSTSASATATSSVMSPSPTAPPPGYPEPIVVSSDFDAGGYYLPNSDVAVLSLLSFEPTIPAEWQLVVQKFLATAKADGKTKLIIDLAANGGGLIFQGYDTFRQLFPEIVQDGNTRFRNHPAFDEMAKQISSEFPPGFNPQLSDSDTLINDWENVFNYKFDYNFTNQPFPTLQDKLGPEDFYNDTFTNIIKWDFDDPLLTINETYGVGEDITGYRSRAGFTNMTFAAEDIVMIYDGYCASTCTLFSEFMRIQGNVKSIAFGGRSTPAGETTPIIQAVGGTKGANNWAYSYINSIAERAVAIGSTDSTVMALTSSLPVNRSTDTSLNVRDNILRYNIGDGTPAQFIYEPADCRLFYTPAMMINVTAIWEAAAEAAWGNSGCNAGSLPGWNGTGYNGVWRRDGESAAVQRRAEVVRLAGARSSDRADDWIARNVMSVPK